MDRGERLSELFMALFDSDAELRRFLALYDFVPPKTRPNERSIRTTALQAARTLQENNQINEALFDALADRSGRNRDVWEVARFYGVGVEPPAEATSSTATPLRDVPPELAGFAQDLLADLDALQVPDDSARALDSDHWPWTAAAAVLGSFLPKALLPLPGWHISESALLALADFTFPSFDGSWVLRQEFRIPCLRRLWQQHELVDALGVNTNLPDLHRDLIAQVVDGWWPPLGSVDTRSLEALGVVVDWLTPVLPADLSERRAAVAAAAERRQLMDPLKALAGHDLFGREVELGDIRSHIALATPEPVLCIQGPGGIGKSSLMGRVLLELEDQVGSGGSPISFAYVDFDRARHDPNDAIGLLEQIARQLRLLYATAAEGSQFAAFESVAAGTDVAYAAELLQIGTSPSVPDMVDALAERLRQVRDIYSPWATSLVLALDTFEEVQIRGPGATHNVLELTRQLQQALPDMRLIVSGRGVIREFEDSPSTRVMWLEDLDAEAAEAVLAYLGVTDPGLRRLIARQFGGNPLTLRLAARALADGDTDTGEESFDSVIAQANALAKVSVELVQGILYRRILGHIPDQDVVKVAYPGLAVRRITVDVLRQVLAEPCGFAPDRAEAIFERLQRDVAMFDLESGGALRHRQDVRRLMLRIMRDDPRQAAVVQQIHLRAAAYYAARHDDEGRAEEIYHRLMSGGDPRQLDKLWDHQLNPRLASAMDEPLPARARSWLGQRLGLASVADEQAEWDQEDWEANAAYRASSWLASGQPAECLQVLSERSRRVDGSRLYALEVAAHTALGQLTQAAAVLDHGLHSAVSVGDHVAQLELLEAAIPLRSRQGDGPGLVDAVRSAVAITDVTREPARALQALTGAVLALQELGLTEETAALNAEIVRRFSQLSQADMQDRPELVRRVLHTAGTTSSSVLSQAAVEVGNISKEQDAVFYEDSFVLQDLLQQTSNSGQPALVELAGEVGLPEAGWSIADLTSRAVRFGRAGKVIAVGLEHAHDEQAARELVVDKLVRPLSRERL